MYASPRGGRARADGVCSWAEDILWTCAAPFAGLLCLGFLYALLTIPSTSALPTPRLKALLAGDFVSMLASFALAGPASANFFDHDLPERASTADNRAQISKFGGKGNCSRSSSENSIEFRIGREHARMRLPGAGRRQGSRSDRYRTALQVDPESAASRGLSSRSTCDRPRMAAATSLPVLPEQAEGEDPQGPQGRKIQVLKGGKAGKVINGFGDANRMALRAYDGIKGQPSGSAL